MPDALPISTPPLPTAVGAGSKLSFTLDDYTLALGLEDGKVFQQMTLGDEEWKPMADSPKVNTFLVTACVFPGEVAVVGAGGEIAYLHLHSPSYPRGMHKKLPNLQ